MTWCVGGRGGDNDKSCIVAYISWQAGRQAQGWAYAYIALRMLDTPHPHCLVEGARGEE